MNLTVQELEARRLRFVDMMGKRHPDWDTAVIIDSVNQYYFTGTMQIGVLLIYRDGSYVYGVRRSYARAKQESPLAEIIPMATYRDLAEAKGSQLGCTYLEGEIVPVIMLERLKKYFTMTSVGFLDNVVRTVRSVKSPYELHWITASGEKHRILLEERVPALLREGISEAELKGEVINQMHKLGHQGLLRFHQFQSDMIMGQMGFGTNSLCPAKFDGPGGAKGHSAAAPTTAESERKLQKGDLVFIDLGFGLNGYQTDKTQIYMFGAKPPKELAAAHQFCMSVQNRLVERLKPGEIPSEIYRDILSSMSKEELDCFMGVDNHHQVKFLGHGVGLNIDELPVIAKGFDEPLEENMVVALEPKKGVAGIGMSGVEETYIVKPDGGYCITGGWREIIVVK